MSFTFKDSDGGTVRRVVQCQCGHIQIERHFGDDGRCPLCQESDYTEVETIKETAGMSNFRYRKLLDSVQTNCAGVGDSTISAIRDEYEDGNDFFDACREAYDTADWSGLTCINGVGESTAETIALGVAEMRDWEDGRAELPFTLTT